MKKVGRFWLPDEDAHFKLHVKRNQYYQYRPYNAAVVHVDKDKRGFLDVGAHCGLWSCMAHNHGFKKIIAVEPDKRNIECYRKNMEGVDYSLYTMAVSDEPASAVCIKEREDNSGSIRIEPSESGDVQVSTIDEVMKSHPDVNIGLVKIDVEGLETNVVLGAKNTLLKHKPVVIVEQRQRPDAVVLLQELGMKVVDAERYDFILKFRED